MSALLSWVQQLPWQNISAGLMGLAALAHVARRWWPQPKGRPSSGCGSCGNCGNCDVSGSTSTVCHTAAFEPAKSVTVKTAADPKHRVIPITQTLGH